MRVAFLLGQVRARARELHETRGPKACASERGRRRRPQGESLSQLQQLGTDINFKFSEGLLFRVQEPKASY